MHTTPGRATASGADTTTQQAEPIAIVGMAGRFPGSPDIDTFWEQLCAGVDAISEIPPDRYDIDAIFEPAPSSPGRTSSKWGGFLDRIREFDAQFFGISPREAARMDPQQRLLMETTYEALEDAGQATDKVAGSNTGVYVGQLGGDYWHLQYQRPDELEFYGLIGAAARAMTSGRLAYTFDFRGPSVTIDTACSSSLTAVHMAAQSIRSGETTMAVAGAANVVLLPEEGTVYSGARMLADDGRCKFGDASADGFVRSDGVGVVVLKSLAQARADGDRVRAVILGSAIGNDGQSSGYLVTPGVDGQRDVLLRAYEQAGVSPAEIDYLEAHGTGTSVGDKVELEVFGKVLGPGRPADRPCLVGSSKTNIGHAEAAAGMAGLIKTILCLEHGQVPPNLHQHTPNPAIPWADLPVRLPRELTPLPERDKPTLAGVSSFGLTGANAHVVLSAPTADVTGPARGRSERDDARTELLALSAMSPEALSELATSYAELLEAGKTPALRDLCHSAGTRRSHFDSRLALPVSSRADAAATLRAFAEHGEAPGLSAVDYVEEEQPRVAFVFPGQGSQWIGMGRELLDTDPVFLDAMRKCDEVIAAENGWSVIDLLRGDDADRFARVDVIQPTLWAMEIALAAVWRSWGVEPDVVIGHSMGEAAAAYVAGALSLEDAGAVICRRSRMARRLSGHGTMAWVELSADEATDAIAGYEDKVALAAANSPTSTLLSGDRDALAEILDRLEEKDVFNRWINVDYASHGPQMDAIREDLLSELADLAPTAGAIPLHSTLLNETVDGSELDASYWARNIREPVDFVGAVRGELDAGETVFVEISPHAVLAGAIDATAADHGQPSLAVGSLRREENERGALLTSLAKLYTAGVSFDWKAVTTGGVFTPLPRYPWQRVEHWLEEEALTSPPRTSAPPPGAQDPEPTTPEAHTHPLLGREVPALAGSRMWEGTVDLARNTYLEDHQVQGTVILPGTAYIELAAAAAQQIHGAEPVSVSKVQYHEAIFLDADASTTIRVTLKPSADRHAFRLHSRTTADETWTLHAEAHVAPVTSGPGRGTESVEAIRERCPEHQSRAEFYGRHAERGNQWNGAFQAIDSVWRTDGEALAALECPEQLRHGWDEHRFHPAVLDAAAHALVAARPDIEPGEDGAFVLGGISEVALYAPPTTRMWSHVRLLDEERADSFSGHVRILDDAGRLVAELKHLRLQYLLGKAPKQLAEPSASGPLGPAQTEYDDWLYELQWIQRDIPAPVSGSDRDDAWVVLTDSGPTGRQVVKGLRDAGSRVVVVTAARGYSTMGGDRYRIDPTSRTDLAKVLLETEQRTPVRGIVHMWSLDATCSQDALPTEIRRAEDLTCGSVVHLAQAMDEVGLAATPRLWLVSRSAQWAAPGDTLDSPFQAPLWGLGRTLAIEHPDWRTGLVDLDDQQTSTDALISHLLRSDEESQVALRHGRRLVARMSRKDLRSAQGIPAAPAERKPDSGEVTIRVTHAGLASHETRAAVSGRPVSFDCVGTVQATGAGVRGLAVGDPVVALARGRVSETVTVSADLVARRPEQLSPAEAATMPYAFVTAYRALHESGRVSAGEQVLIDDATGELASAAEQVSRWLSAGVCDVTANVELSENRGTPAYDVVLTTRGRRNAPSQNSVLAPGGRYLDAGPAYGAEPASIEPDAFRANRSFHAIDVPDLVEFAPGHAGDALRRVCELTDQRVLRPLPYTELPLAQAGDTPSGRKVVVTLPQHAFSESHGEIAPSQLDIRADATYLVTGGIGGIGGQLAEWLVDQGARHLLLTGRSSLPPVETWESLDSADPRRAQTTLLRQLTDRGAEVEYAAVDTADLDAMRTVLGERADAGLPRLRGVVHAAGTIEYAPIRELEPEQVQRALHAKVSGAWALHRLLERETVDFFVLFSSGSALLGSPLLGGYAAGNAFLDALAQHRVQRGQTATVVNWGFWESVGMMARKAQEDGQDVVPRGMDHFSPSEGLRVMGQLIESGSTQAAVLRVDWRTWAQAYPTLAATPQLRDLVQQESLSLGSSSPVRAAPEPADVPRPKSVRLTPALKTWSMPADEAAEAPPQPPKAHADPDDLEQSLVGMVASILSTPTDRINTAQPLKRMGMDSLMAVELRTRIDREYKVNVPLAKLLRGGTITKVAEHIRTQAPGHLPTPMTTPTAGAPTTPAVPKQRPKPAPEPAAPSVREPEPAVATALHAAPDDLEQSLVGMVASILSTPTDRINTAQPLKRMGMDSLMAVELRTRIDREYKVNVPLAKLLRGGTITKVAEHIRTQA
ncbi:type I polyketide synthase [Streptomyces gobiensis]|uniref:type I polyketide synthase n=1 Tax=Streptomyces gobiensis TaxID=2875706 RepID=UPI0024118D09|nr:type I polyketide synthase [Streptomyces gobiensis]UGY91630.1 SDR family NAD(P)-dependent oxidoreductase [Streptomyces gobiensis]